MKTRNSFLLALASAAIPLSAGEAEASIALSILEQGSSVVIQASGSLSGLPAPLLNQEYCDTTGVFYNAAASGFLCLGATNPLLNVYTLATPAPANFSGSLPLVYFNQVGTQNSGVGLALCLNCDLDSPGQLLLGLAESYLFGDVISSSVEFTHLALADLGIFGSGLIGLWQVEGSTETIRFDAVASSVVPGPSALLGAAAAFHSTRQLRRRSRGQSISQT